jgi:hypothetical protein
MDIERESEGTLSIFGLELGRWFDQGGRVEWRGQAPNGDWYRVVHESNRWVAGGETWSVLCGVDYDDTGKYSWCVSGNGPTLDAAKSDFEKNLRALQGRFMERLHAHTGDAVHGEEHRAAEACRWLEDLIEGAGIGRMSIEPDPYKPGRAVVSINDKANRYGRSVEGIGDSLGLAALRASRNLAELKRPR